MSEAFARGLTVREEVRWLGWSRLTDLARRHVAASLSTGSILFFSETKKSFNRRLRGFRQPNRRFEFQKPSQLPISAHNERLALAAMGGVDKYGPFGRSEKEKRFA